MPDLELLQRKLERERAARKEAESLLEKKSLEVFNANTQLQTLADQMHQQAQQTNAIIETAAEGIIVYDQEGTIQLFNRSAVAVFEQASVAGRNIRELFETNPEVIGSLFPDCTNPFSAYGSGCSLQDNRCMREAFECVAKRDSGQTFIAEVSTSRSEYGGSVVFTAMVRDLSRRKKLEAQLSQAQKMESIGQLAAGMAHEINTPIQFVGDNLQFLKSAFDDLAELLDLFQKLLNEETHPSTEAKETAKSRLIQEIHSQSELVDFPFLREEFPSAISQSLEGIERVANIVRAMKEFSQPASDGKTSTDINRTIENTLAVMANQLMETARVDLSLDRTLEPLVCLSGQLSQALLNVLTNAIEAIEEHKCSSDGLISVSTRIHEGHVQIRITDNGPGIPATIQDRIFEPFFTTKEVGKGSGQGLAFVYDVIVNKHEGSVHAFSPVEGGTTFVLCLPVASNSKTKRQDHANFIS